MIEILLKNKELLIVENISNLNVSDLDFNLMQFIDYSNLELSWLEENYGIDLTILKNYEDIEISSHFLENEQQAAFHFSIPYLNKDDKMDEEHVFMIVSKNGLFHFSNSKLNTSFNELYANKLKTIPIDTNSENLFLFHFEFITDYYADITEVLTKKIKILANTILIDKVFSNNELDIITRYNFSSLLIKEALLETTRVFSMYMKSNWEQKTGLKQNIKVELKDLSAVSDYIQFNFDRLNDLKENVSNKIDLEQNYIFKMLTVVTVCISLPTFIAGIYGMNFNNMPELKSTYGYPIALVLMILSAVLPFIYFKKKKWLK